MKRLVKITKTNDIFPELHQTPVSLLLEFHNLNKPFEIYSKAQLLIGMCMDNRKRLRIPDNFAYIIRSGGANLKHHEFNVSYAISVGDIKHIALIGHNNCGMVNLNLHKSKFINGLVEKAGWDKEEAKEHFLQSVPIFEIENEIDFVISEAKRLRTKYPKITIAPMFYKLNDNQLYLIREK